MCHLVLRLAAEPRLVSAPRICTGSSSRAELFNLTQALGFWWTCANERVRERRAPSRRVAVDVFIPVYKEPPDIVDLTVAAAAGCAARR